jgi:hypothetical protein
MPGPSQFIVSGGPARLTIGYHGLFSGCVVSWGLSKYRFWRVAAMVMLLYAGFDILAVDTALWTPQGTVACCDDCDSNDCFCCCRHIVVVPPIGLRPVHLVTAFVEHPAKVLESVPASVPELPPRA